MKTFAWTAMGLAALGAAGCQQTSTNNGTTKVEFNGAEAANRIENGLKDAGNYAREAGNIVGNELKPAGEVIKNGAREAWNGVKEGVREIRGREESGNQSGR
jgi:hypothetical protein